MAASGSPSRTPTRMRAKKKNYLHHVELFIQLHDFCASKIFILICSDAREAKKKILKI